MVIVKSKRRQNNAFVQLLVSLVIPIIILTRFSGEDQLGAVGAFLFALAFPVVYELFGFFKYKKISYFSLLAIGGIVVTGTISLLGLSEGWLAIRRSVPYLAGALALLISVYIKHPILQALLPNIIDMEIVYKQAHKKHTTAQLNRRINQVTYLLSALLVALTVISYISTRIVIVSATNTTGFNQEYARLRLWSLPFVTLPLGVGVTAIIMYLAFSIEKLTGLEFEKFLKKK